MPGVDAGHRGHHPRRARPTASRRSRPVTHVLVEKPGARTLSRAPHGCAATRRRARARTVRVGFNHRFHPAFVRSAASSVDGRRLRPADAHPGPLRPRRAARLRAGVAGRRGAVRAAASCSTRASTSSTSPGSSPATSTSRFAELRTDVLADGRRGQRVPRAARPSRRRSRGCTRRGPSGRTSSRSRSRCRDGEARGHRARRSYGAERLTLYEMRPEMGPPPTTDWEWPRRRRVVAARARRRRCGASRAGRASAPTLDDAVATLSLIEEAYRR